MRNETILNKMKKEITRAKEVEHDQESFLTHINNVKLLCELFLEDKEEAVSTPKSSTPSFRDQEIKAMMGNQRRTNGEEKQSAAIDHDGANGTSIFDF